MNFKENMSIKMYNNLKQKNNPQEILSRKNTKPLIRQELESIPNINNQEQSWVSITGVTDTVSPELTIDNNEFYTDEALKNINNAYNTPNIKKQAQKEEKDDLYKFLASLEDDEYLLFINGIPVCSGYLLDIQDQAEKFVSGSHELSLNNPIDLDDILIIKKVKIKFGLFLEK